MTSHSKWETTVGTALLAWAFATSTLAASGDFDANGYVDYRDYCCLANCLADSGPGVTPGLGWCIDTVDTDGDGDVDLTDFAQFARSLGHRPMPLKDYLGNAITADSTRPYSRRQTCGGASCHDVDHVANGIMFQQGRTSVTGQIDMRDDYYGDGRTWIKSSGRYGKWGQSFIKKLAAKHNTRASEIDQTAFAWARDCGGCHPGGGPGEFDRDGVQFYNEVTGDFGYELLGQTPEQVALDGDYSLLDYSSGAVTPAPWDVTGVSEPDCLVCHRGQRTWENSWDMNWAWRSATLAAGASLVDDAGQPVPAFLAAGTAGQGWHSTLEMTGFPGLWPKASTLQIDYTVGLTDGSLVPGDNGTVSLAPASVTWPPWDRACWSCHFCFGVMTGTVWFDETNVMYRRFNNLHDDDPANDIPPEKSVACTVCHPGNFDHNFAKGNSLQVQFRDALDWDNLRSCRSCHLADSPTRHPDAPVIPNPQTSDEMHRVPGFDHVSCQGCHIPYGLSAALLFRDITVGTVGMTTQYLSADPLNPEDSDKSRWYPAFLLKEDVDGVERLFPCNIWTTIYWGDWDRKGTPEDVSDDIITPISVWRVEQVTGGILPVVTDDNGDGQPEINRPEEILAYIQRLKTCDTYGVQVAANPVLVKGIFVWHEDSEAPDGVSSFSTYGVNSLIDWYPYLWGMDHNVRPVKESWGYSPGNPQEGCRHCHRPGTYNSPVMDRKVLVDPYGPDGEPFYVTVRQMTTMHPP
ncbi:MAG: hypothetical protein PVI86_01455 [Phycisphaerae bacterium]|jgi:hypothetical protein